MSDFTFIDLFAGIGGMRIAMQDLGGECVFSSENEPMACRVYEENFGVNPMFDITKVDVGRDLPETFDVLVGGFPCQAFSMAGLRQGFNDDRGRLFEQIERILREMGDARPKAFLLENVKGLVSHDGGRTLEEILRRLRGAGYVVPEPKVLNAKDYNVPQKRERVYIVGFRDDMGVSEGDFLYPGPVQVGEDDRCTMQRILEHDVPRKYYLSQQYLDCLKRHKEAQREKGRGFGYEILGDDDLYGNTLVVGGMGRERNLVVGEPLDDYSAVNGMHSDINRENIRKLTPREFSRMQRFPRDFKINVADTHAYRLFGNSVAVDVVYHVGLQMLKTLKDAGQIEHYSERDPDSTRYDYWKDSRFRQRLWRFVVSSSESFD